MTRSGRLKDIVKCCVIRFNRGEVATWKHGDFVDLHREIHRETNINISPSTLKRIFGKISVDEGYVPQQATLDALKKYGKYVEPDNITTTPTLPDSPSPKRSFNQLKLVLAIILVSIVIIGLLTWRSFKPNNIQGKISILRTEGQLPATAFFELQLPNTDDSLFVNFGDKSPMVYIKSGEKSAAHIYYIPGVFTVSLQTRHQTIDTTSAYIRSDKWIAFGCHRQDDIPMRFYSFPAIKTGADSLFQITNRQLATMGLDTTGPVLTRLCNYTPVAHSADDFIFNATFKNFVQEGISCRSAQFQISGSNGIIRFRLVSSGCSLRVLNVISEQTFRGATNDLSAFVSDLSHWNNMQLVNHNRQVSLSLNGKEIFRGSYQQPLGDLKGVFLEFEGSGVVKNCDLKSFDEKMLYHF